MHVYYTNSRRETVNSLLFGEDSKIWVRSMSNILGRLTQGNKYGVKATDTIDFITKNDVTITSKVKYTNCACDYRPLKTEKHRLRLVVGGYKLDFDGDAGAPAASLIEIKLLHNSVISGFKDGARFMSCNLKDFFLATPMLIPEYMKINNKYIP